VAHLDTFDAVAAALSEGEPAVVPTDTLFGIAVSPLHAPSPGILYQIKGRPSDKPVAWLVASADALDAYGRDVPAYARCLADAFWPGALTLIVKAGEAVPPAYRSTSGTIGLRMPDDALTRSLADKLGCPLAVTSANISGQPDPCRFDDIDARILSQVAAAIDDERRKSGIGSTVLDCTGFAPRILREGAVTAGDIAAALGRIG
jgi:tRNA threonylcarbamoyl adenosine modification protein (Sua5/YciO/YrdC/YwlC family)